jgi:hypothetical protein
MADGDFGVDWVGFGVWLGLQALLANVHRRTGELKCKINLTVGWPSRLAKTA